MYESGYRRINWVKLFLIVIIIVLIILLTIKCISMIKYSSNNVEKYYDKQLNSINKVVLDYYNKDNIPTEVGTSSKMSLKELKEKDVKIKVESYKDNKCNLDESYAQATRLETEYQVKTRLYCTDSDDNVIYDDYINTYVDLTEGTTKKTEKKKTTKKETKATTEKKTKETKKETTKATTTEKVTEKTTEPTTVKTTKKTTKATTTTKKVVTTTKKVNTTQATVKSATNNEVTVGFNTNGGTLGYTSKTITKGSSMELPVPVRTGYKFIGWYKNGVKYTNTTKFNESIILVAEWSEN